MAGRTPGPIGLTSHPVIDPGTSARTESYRPGPLVGGRPPSHRDELTPIARYIAAEMNANAHGETVKRIAELNAFSADACIADFSKLPLWRQILGAGIEPNQCVEMQISYRTAALITWALKVRQNGDWDHKPRIAASFHPRVAAGNQHWHLYGNVLYYYEVWSNLHYGYVGTAAGFSETVLLDGAGLEQIGSDLTRLNIPAKSPSISGLRAWDAPADREAITIGIRLHRQKSGWITETDVLRPVVTSGSILTKPYSP